MSTPKWIQEIPVYVKAISGLVFLVTATAAVIASTTLGDIPKNVEAIVEIRGDVSALQGGMVAMRRQMVVSDSLSAARDRFLICLLTDAKDATGIEAQQICSQ